MVLLLLAFTTMASTSNPAPEPDPEPPLTLDSLRRVDLRGLSQSELYALSLCSPRTCDLDDAVIPKIDRSVFNESAGSRKQTYSRIRFTSAGPRRTRRAGSQDSDPEKEENPQIVALFKKLFGLDTGACGNEEVTPVGTQSRSDSVPPI